MSWNTLTASSATAGSIANWMSKASISSGADGVADTILQEACSWIYRRLRHWRMLTSPVSITMSIGDPTLPFQTGMLEPDLLWYINGSPVFMVQKEVDQVYMSRQYTSGTTLVQQPPILYSFNMDEIEMDCAPDQAYGGFITYYKQLDALSQSNPTNFLTTYYQRLLRLACMAGACEWAKDNGQGNIDRTYWDTLAEDEIYKAQQESDRARRGVINAANLIGGGGFGYPAYAPGTW